MSSGSPRRGLLVSRVWIQASVLVMLFGFTVMAILASVHQVDRGCPPADLAHANVADAALTKRQCFLGRANHDDFRGPVRQGYGSGGEGPEHVDDCHWPVARVAPSKALDRVFIAPPGPWSD